MSTALAALIIFSCSDNEMDSHEADLEAEEIEIFEDSFTAEDDLDGDIQIAHMAEALIQAGGKVEDGIFGCAEVTRDPEANTITIDFKQGCPGPWGRTRRGIIVIQYDGPYDNALTRRIINFIDYYLGQIRISGSITLEQGERDENGHLLRRRILNDYTRTRPDGSSFVLRGESLRRWIAGEGDGDIDTNVVEITGELEGRSTRGRNFRHVIVEPVIADFACRRDGFFLYKAGLKEMTFTGPVMNRVRTVRYGDGECTKTITITINGRNTIVTRD